MSDSIIPSKVSQRVADKAGDCRRNLPFWAITFSFFLFSLLIIVYARIIAYFISFVGFLLSLWAYAWQRKRNFEEYERVMNSIADRSENGAKCLRCILSLLGKIYNGILTVLWKCFSPCLKAADKALLEKHPKLRAKLHRLWEHTIGCCAYASLRVVAKGNEMAETQRAKAWVEGPAPPELKEEAQELLNSWTPLYDAEQNERAIKILEKAQQHSDHLNNPFSKLRSLLVTEIGKQISSILYVAPKCDEEIVTFLGGADSNLGKEAKGSIDQQTFFTGAGQMEQISNLLRNLDKVGASLDNKEMKRLQPALNDAATYRLEWALKKGHKEIRYAISCAQALHALKVPAVAKAAAKYKELRELPPDWDILAMITQKHGGYRLVAKKAVPGSLLGLTNVPGSLSHTLQKLMDDTFISKYTRDRKDAKVPEKLVLLRAHSVQNEQNFVEYMARQKKIRDDIKANSISGNERVDPRTMTSEASQKLPKLDDFVQEAWMWHGTTKAGADGISNEDFRLNLAGSAAGTLYGRGVYLAEACSKSDEYAEEENGERHLLLCRATLGRANYTDKASPNTKDLEDKCINGKYHCTLGDREKARGTFREFIVYDDDQVYPEFIICYRRQYYSEDAQIEV